jgi:DNA topoisomerase-1
LRDFYYPFAETLEIAEQEIGKIKVEDEVSDQVCELCGKKHGDKDGEVWQILSLSRFPGLQKCQTSFRGSRC